MTPQGALLRRLLPESLAGRVLSLYALTFLAFSVAALVTYTQFYVSERIAQLADQKSALLGVMVPTLTDSVVIGDFDTIKRLLERAAQDPDIQRASFIEKNSAKLEAGHAEVLSRAPDRLVRWLEKRLLDSNETITAGGRDYGVLRLEFDHSKIAEGIWFFVVVAAFTTAMAVLTGGVLIGIPLRRWLKSLEQVSRFQAGSTDDPEGVSDLPEGLPRELRETFRVVSKNAAALRKQALVQGQVIDAMRSLLGMPAGAKDTNDADPTSEMTTLTERVRELVASRERAQLAMSNQKHALDEHAVVAVFNTEGRFLEVNQKYCELVGMHPGELIGRFQSDFTEGTGMGPVINDIKDTVRSGRVWHGEVELRAADGLPRVQQATVVPFLDMDRKMQQFIAIYTDVSERKKAEADLRTLNESLEQRVRARTSELLNSTSQLQHALDREREFGRVHERLSGMLSHEFRTPLSVITSATELISGHLDKLPSHERAKIVARLERASNRMTDMLEDALTIGRLTGERYVPRWTDVLVKQFLEGLVDDVRTSSGQKRQFILRVERSADILITTDERLLHQALSNLLSNAVKYSPEDTPVILAATCTQEEIQFSITDRGRGIAPEDLPKLFEPFYRGRGVELIQGTGLGLSICQKAAELFGGSVRVQSEPGQGSTFTFIVSLRAVLETSGN